MEVIKHGNTYKQIICSECNCTFSYCKKDIKETYLYDPESDCNCILYKYIHCPECYERIPIKESENKDAYCWN